MNTVCASVTERSRKFLQLALQRLASVGQVGVSEQLGVSESTISRFIATDLERACQVLAAVGLKVVPIEMKCYPKGEIDAIFALARGRLNQVDNVESLSFE